MSWLFGFNKPPPPSDEPPLIPSRPLRDGNWENEGVRIASVFRNLNPLVLERAAEAVRVLENSQHSKEILEIARLQEETKLLEQQCKIKEYEVNIQKMQMEKMRVEQEEKRKTLVEETQQHQQHAQYQDQLARKRYEDQLSQQRHMIEEKFAKHEQSVKKREAMKRGTMEYEAQIKHENEMKRLQAELRGKASIERESKDIRMEQIKLEAVLQSIKILGSILEAGFSSCMSDWNKISIVAGGLTFVAFSVFTAKHGTGVTAKRSSAANPDTTKNADLSTQGRFRPFKQVEVTAKFVEACCGKPSLVRETSRISIWGALLHPVHTVRKMFVNYEDSSQRIILRPSLEKRLQEITKASAITKKNKGLYRNLLLYGPPGTGKTMFAKSLAKHSGMDYGILSGGDIVPMGKEGGTAMHKVFDWAQTSKRGLLLFVDEADAILHKRNQEKMSEDLRSTLNAFLYRTGESSRKFILVLASNQPDQFDRAISDRLDEMIEFSLPSLEERVRLIQQYFKEHVLKPATTGSRTSRMKIANFDLSKKCQQIAEVTEGLSGREISKIAIAWQASAYGSPDGVLTEDMMDERVDEAVRQHKQKVEWHQAEPLTETTASVTTTEKNTASSPKRT